MGRKALSPEQKKINKIESVKKYQQSNKYKEYKRNYWLRKRELIDIHINTKNKIIKPLVGKS